MTSEFVFGPDSRGAAIVVASTASTVPLNRTDRTKSRSVTVAVDSRPRAPWGVTAAARVDRTTAAPATRTEGHGGQVLQLHGATRSRLDTGETRMPRTSAYQTVGVEPWLVMK